MSIQRLSNSGQSGYRYKTLIAGITPVASVPVIGEATAVTYSTASVAFTAPGAYAATTFTATSSPGGFTGTRASSPITVSGLSEQTEYTFTVTATNATGTSSPSAASNSITTPAAFTPAGAYDSLATVTLSATTASATFSGIPTGYKHLQVRYLIRNDTAAYFLRVQVNGVTSATNYTGHNLTGDGASASAGSYQGSVSGDAGILMPRASATAGYFTTGIIDVLDYASSTKYKTFRGLGGYDINAAGGKIELNSGFYFGGTSPITSLTFGFTAGSFVANSQFALYGVK